MFWWCKKQIKKLTTKLRRRKEKKYSLLNNLASWRLGVLAMKKNKKLTAKAQRRKENETTDFTDYTDF